MVKGKEVKCQYLKRRNHHFRSLANGVLHVCNFTQKEAIGPLDRIVHELVAGEAGEMWDLIVRFVGQANIPISTAASPEFHQIIKASFLPGFDRALKNPKANVDREFTMFFPPRSATAVRGYVIQAASDERARLENELRENRFAAMTMDGGQISSLSLFITNLVAAHLSCCFTAGIAKIEKCHTHFTLRDFLRDELQALADKGIIVSVITCDGASYQTKVLNYHERYSLNGAWTSHHPLFSRILYMPCLCHRLNNAYHRLVKVSHVFSEFIGSLRRLGVFCRKPNQRRRLGRNCPAFIATRWLYDFRILDFAIKNQTAINGLGDAAHQVQPIFVALYDLLKLWSELVTLLEGSSCSLSMAYPQIRITTEALAAIRDRQDEAEIREIYEIAIQLLYQYTIDSTYDLLQFASVLTPGGRKEAFHQLDLHLGSVPPGHAALELKLVDFQGQLADHEVELIINEEAEPNEEEDDNEAADEQSVEVDSPEFAHTETVTLHVPAARFSSTCLPHRARVGLDRILDQFDLGEQSSQSARQVFNHYLTSVESSLGVMAAPDGTRYCWLSAQTGHEEWACLAEIALRLEPAICSEAPSERSIGQHRRFLLQHRARTNPDLLLARTTLEDRRNQRRPSQGDASSVSAHQ
jgi:hypothetical protein